MVKINPYLNLPGTSEEAFTFYKSVLGGEFAGFQKFKDTPEGAKLSPDEGEKMMHIALPIGDNILMSTDALESMGHKLTTGNDFQLSLQAESKEEADRIFNGLSAGGKVELPMQDMFWGDYFGMFQDKFGVKWMVAFAHPRN